MRELNLDRLRTLLAVCDLGSFAAAAQALHLAPPTVTLHVAELESRLGAPLLVRARGAVVPTAVGVTLIDRARRLLADADDAWDTVQAQLAGGAGRVRLGASTGVIAHLLPRALQRLAATHPGIDVQVQVLTSGESMARLAGGRLDLALVALPQPPMAGVAVRAWRRDPVMAFVPAAWSPPARVTPAWLAQRPLILNDSSTRLWRLTADWFAHAGVHARARIELNYNDAIKSLVAAGYGAALLPHEASAAAPDDRLAMRPLRPALWRALGLAHRVGAADGATQRVLQVLVDLDTGEGNTAIDAAAGRAARSRR
jgi:DNA-binding transcriptional LysR family regulator